MRSPALAALVAGFALLGAPRAERFGREVDEGTSLRRTFVRRSTLELEELRLELDGEPHPAGGLSGIELRRSAEIVVEDDFGPPAGGRPRRLVRWFGELDEESVRAVTGPDGDTEERRSAGSDLERRSVLFALGHEDRGEYRVSWEGKAGDDELLAGLVEDMDLRAFLPAEGELDPGAAWEVSAGAYLLLARPGGIELAAPGDGEHDRRLADELCEQLAGEIAAVYRGRREVDGRALAVVALELALESEASAPVPTDDDVSVRVSLRAARELRGELLWDSAHGHLHALELGGRVELEERTTIVSGAHVSEQLARYSGPLELSVRVERLE